MIYRALLLATLLCTSISSWGISPPDMEAVRDSISNPSSPLYYDRLFDRYSKSDSTLTLNDYHYLYYGYADQIEYMPLLDNSARGELEEIMSGQMTATEEDYRRAISLCTKLLEIEPFNPRDLNALAYLYAMTGNEEGAAEQMHKLQMIVTTIKNTGTGLTESSPWWITYFPHAEDILALEGLEHNKAVVLSKSIEFIPIVKTPSRKDKGYYFNFSLIYARGNDYMQNIDNPKRQFDWAPWQSSSKFQY